MKGLALTMRVEVSQPHGERRDALDQRWHRFLAACGLYAMPAPNHPESALAILEGAAGLILSGGNDLVRFAGDAPERDTTEQVLLEAALARNLPVIGVCRGMQFLADHFGCVLAALPDHIGTRHSVGAITEGPSRMVNSFHNYGITAPGDAMIPLAVAPDGSIESFSHQALPVHGIMWHPEREDIPQAEDTALFREIFRALR